MATLKELKERIKSIGSIHKITSAMELVSIAKSRRYVKELASTREFYNGVLDLFYRLSSDDSRVASRFLGGKNRAYIVIGSDLGLCGGFNVNLVKSIMENSVKSDGPRSGDTIITVGSKPNGLIRSRFNVESTKFYTHLEFTMFEKTAKEISDILFTNLLRNQYKEVILVYTKPVSPIAFETIYAKLLPANLELMKKVIGPKYVDNRKADAFKGVPLYEPNAETIISYTIKLYFESIILGALKESFVAEHSQRRISMENASSNGEELLNELTISANRLRQAKITQEISEIIGGSEASN